MKAFWEILRPFNCLMASAAAIIGLALAGGMQPWDTGLIFLAVFLITGAGNAINDYYDREIDAINRPGRPLPSGRISPAAAWRYSMALFLADSALLFFYARNLKAMPLSGNICVAFLTGSTFLFGGAAVGMQGLMTNQVPFFLSFLVSMSREIAKDIEDMAGDLVGGARTLPILAGERLSRALAAGFALAAVALSFLPPFGRGYLVVVAVADILFLLSVKMILKGDATGAQKALKKGMAVALVAFLAGALLF
ncbi:MAG: 4-hydroxybenzoate octaprenyltransferase [Methanosaeta sp. NSP1]|nr:MAG: 4-hydroxybenzoate octaprenyltransferase [Methanosaeta sp. NSP1]